VWGVNLSSKWFKLFVIVFALLCLAQSASAEWKVRKTAEVRNEDNYLFRVTMDDNGVIRAWMHLPKDMPGAFASKLPVYQVDDNKVREIPPVKEGTFMDREKKSWIAWKISARNQNPGQELKEIMTGREITFQYYMPDGAIYEATFSLKGAKEAIGELLNN